MKTENKKEKIISDINENENFKSILYLLAMFLDTNINVYENNTNTNAYTDGKNFNYYKPGGKNSNKNSNNKGYITLITDNYIYYNPLYYISYGIKNK